MCEAFEATKNKGIALGEVSGSQKTYVLTCQEFNCTYEDTLRRFSKKFRTSKSESKKIVDQYWKFH